MARNQEKAQSMLNRFLTMKREGGTQLSRRTFGDRKRPLFADEVVNLREAEKWRFECVREISKKVTQIQHETVGEVKIRELNDLINKLIREKYHWERRIMELGGPDYRKHATKITDAMGNEIAGQTGYLYFGAARTLPGVQEMLQRSAAMPKGKSRRDLLRAADLDYYGLRDDDDGTLAETERVAEQKAREEADRDWNSVVEQMSRMNATAAGDEMAVDLPDLNDEAERTRARETAVLDAVAVPDEQRLEQLIVAKRKQELLRKYVSGGMLAAASE